MHVLPRGCRNVRTAAEPYQLPHTHTHIITTYVLPPPFEKPPGSMLADRVPAEARLCAVLDLMFHVRLFLSTAPMIVPLQ